MFDADYNNYDDEEYMEYLRAQEAAHQAQEEAEQTSETRKLNFIQWQKDFKAANKILWQSIDGEHQIRLNYDIEFEI